MLATTSWMPGDHLPRRPSPLSPRSANARPRFPAPFMSAPSDAKPDAPFSRRPVRANPAMQSRDAAKEKRRDMFLKRVQQDREDRRWEVRGEQIMRLDFVSRRKRWETEQARSAPRLDGAIEEEEESHGAASSSQNDCMQLSSYPSEQRYPDEEREAEAVMQQEDQEVEALVSLMDEEERAQHYGSDEEDYDSLFMDYVQSEEAHRPNIPAALHNQIEDVMDTSNG